MNLSPLRCLHYLFFFSVLHGRKYNRDKKNGAMPKSMPRAHVKTTNSTYAIALVSDKLTRKEIETKCIIIITEGSLEKDKITIDCYV